jgi:hypothetical protein
MNYNYSCIGSDVLHARSVRFVCEKSCFLVLYMWRRSRFVFPCPNCYNIFPFELTRFRFPLNLVFVSVSSLLDFDFSSVLKCKSENRRGFILTDLVRFHP